MVYVIQEPKQGPNGYVFDLSSSLPYGTPVFIFKAGEQPSLSPGPSMQRAKKTLQDFTDEDYLLWAGGDPAGLAIVSMAAADSNLGKIKFLRWERERVEGSRTGRGYYMPVEISLRGQK